MAATMAGSAGEGLLAGRGQVNHCIFILLLHGAFYYSTKLIDFIEYFQIKFIIINKIYFIY